MVTLRLSNARAPRRASAFISHCRCMALAWVRHTFTPANTRHAFDPAIARCCSRCAMRTAAAITSGLNRRRRRSAHCGCCPSPLSYRRPASFQKARSFRLVGSAERFTRTSVWTTRPRDVPAGNPYFGTAIEGVTSLQVGSVFYRRQLAAPSTLLPAARARAGGEFIRQPAAAVFHKRLPEGQPAPERPYGAILGDLARLRSTAERVEHPGMPLIRVVEGRQVLKGGQVSSPRHRRTGESLFWGFILLGLASCTSMNRL